MTLVQTKVLALLGVAIALAATASPALAQTVEAPAVLPQYETGQGLPGGVDVFHNYYPNTMAGINSASLYPSPIPTPPIVGHTYYTYQPLMPHEMMYAHKRNYYTPMPAPGGYYQDPTGCSTGGYGYNKTTVVWQHHGLSIGPNPLGGCFQKLRGHFSGIGHGCRHCGGHGCRSCGGCNTCR